MTITFRTRAAALVAGLLLALPGAWAARGGDPGVPGDILLKLRSTTDLPPLLAKYPLTLTGQFGARPLYRVRVSGRTSVKRLLPQLALEPGVMIAETNPLHESPEARKNVAWAIGTEQQYRAQWAPAALRLAEAQQLSQGSGVTVAVLDTGVDLTHPALAGRLVPGWDFVGNDADPSEEGSHEQNPGFGHGTHVAGLIALTAPGARIMPLRVLDPDGMGHAWAIAAAVLHAIDPDGNPATNDGVQVINLSLGSLTRTRIIDTIASIAGCQPAIPDDAIGDRSDPGYRDDELRCANTAQLGTVVIAAAGNDGSDHVLQYPAAEGVDGSLAVGATAAGGGRAGFSNFGPWIGIAAPGEGITSSVPGGGWGTWSGTSMSTPLVAGVAALLRAAEPGLKPDEITGRLVRNAAPLCDGSLRALDGPAVLRDQPPADPACP